MQRSLFITVLLVWNWSLSPPFYHLLIAWDVSGIQELVDGRVLLRNKREEGTASAPSVSDTTLHLTALSVLVCGKTFQPGQCQLRLDKNIRLKTTRNYSTFKNTYIMDFKSALSFILHAASPAPACAQRWCRSPWRSARWQRARRPHGPTPGRQRWTEGSSQCWSRNAEADWRNRGDATIINNWPAAAFLSRSLNALVYTVPVGLPDVYRLWVRDAVLSRLVVQQVKEVFDGQWDGTAGAEDYCE